MDITAQNAIYLDEETGGKGRQFKSRFLVPGLVKYDYGVCLLTKENADKFIQGFVGCPVVINHQTVTDDNAKAVSVGNIFSVWFDEKDGYYWCNGIINDKEAIDLINKGYSVSCQYTITEYSDNETNALHNGNPYDKIIENGKPEHLAIVNNPRYEGAKIAVNALLAENEDRWITIKPNGEENKGRHLLLKDGESPKEAIERVYKKEDKSDSKEDKQKQSDTKEEKGEPKKYTYTLTKKEVGNDAWLGGMADTGNYYTNGSFAIDKRHLDIKGQEPKKIPDIDNNVKKLLTETAKKKQKEENYTKVKDFEIGELKSGTGKPIPVAKYSYYDEKLGYTRNIYVNKKYNDLFKNFELKFGSEYSPIYAYDKGDLIGVLMPINGRDSSYTASNSFVSQFKDALYEAIAGGIYNRLGELIASNEDKWITIHPHGEESDDYRRLLIKDGETVEDAMHRQGYYNKRQAKDEKEQKEDKNDVSKKIDYKIYRQKEDELFDKLSKINIDDYKDRDEYNAEIRKIREERSENLDKLKEAYKKEIERIKNIDINKLSYQEIENFEKDLKDIYNDIMDLTASKFIMSKLQQVADIKRSLEAKEKAKKVGGYTEKLQNLANFSHFSDISSYPIELQKHIYDNYKKVYDKFPQLAKQGYGKLAKENIKSSTYANNLSIVNSVTLNSSWYDDLPKLEKSYADDVSSEWHPQGTNYNSIITHELGHGLLGYIQSNLGVSGKAIRSKVLKKLGLHIKDINTHLSRYPNNSRDPVHEFFAEAFAEYMDSPNPRPLAVEFGKEIERIFRDLDKS